jgi:hypothetical protein
LTKKERKTREREKERKRESTLGKWHVLHLSSLHRGNRDRHRCRIVDILLCSESLPPSGFRIDLIRSTDRSIDRQDRASHCMHACASLRIACLGSILTISSIDRLAIGDLQLIDRLAIGDLQCWSIGGCRCSLVDLIKECFIAFALLIWLWISSPMWREREAFYAATSFQDGNGKHLH